MSIYDARGFVPADFDRDGDVDMFVFNNAQPAVYLQNEFGARRSWVAVQLRGKSDNKRGVGAHVRVHTGERTQLREIHTGSGYLASPPPEAHFGLGDAKHVDRLEVRWPNGDVQTFENVDANKVVVVEQGGELSYRALGASAQKVQTQ